MKSLFVFIGFMGAGKTSVSKIFSELTGATLYELDDLIRKEIAPQTISEIFADQGEEYFRKIEGEVFSEVLKNNSGVVSTGGGIVESEENREILKSSDATVIYLDTSFETITTRIGDPSTRPLFLDMKEAKARYKKRLLLYKELATHIISTEERTPLELAEIIRNLETESSTVSPYVNCVIGDPIAHSLSPKMHNAGYVATELHKDCTFIASRVTKEQLPTFISHWKNSERCNGIAVTIPHKETIIPHLNSLSDEAKALGAVNTVTKGDGEELRGENTDWLGIYEPIVQRTSISGKRCCIVGAGGTARAACYAMQKGGGDVTFVNRSRVRGEKIADDFNAKFIALEEIDSLKDFDIVIHTTSVGLGKADETLFSKEAFREGMVVMDVVYTPRETGFLRAAKEGGAEIITGDEMFLAQGRAQFKMFTGRDAPMETMLKEVRKDATGH